MKTTVKKLMMLIITLALTCVVFAFSSSAAGITPGVPDDFINSQKYKLVIEAEDFSVKVRKTVRLSAEVTNVQVQPEITWSSSNQEVATVDSNGLVKGKSVGRAFITANAIVGGKKLEAVYPINVVTKNNVVKSFLMKNQILSYQYSYVDDYYYTNDKECWQENFGFARIYDLVSPFIALEYDYTRVFFTYDNQEFMVQLWKGQYGYIFYGGEIGIYHKKADDKDTGYFTFFKCSDEEYWPKMKMTLYHQDIFGNWNREFTRDYDKYWWCTGFKPGHLRNVEPADELKLEARITFRDREMATLFADGLAQCGYGKVQNKASVGVDEYYHQGKDVYLQWQNISEAETTMGIKVAGGAVLFLNFIGLLIAGLFSMGLGSLFWLIIL